ncbi:type IV pili methyl-accepting chemotaxis transducer N-terminal domain-containing protein [Ralstonia pseudosolanacearum]|uniref:type IV pili methyl-accepting chemotaxis transducer N-terminal domain-containing protein n=1 Tax=Ralstonia pseudosolanacearum TaxID=1310165 RepID=UPI0020C80688|nr:type IV pili methyl-accepting chemotaxis transducer N-terminal domain-containing protein [Ralstonia pseudosolanacearum]
MPAAGKGAPSTWILTRYLMNGIGLLCCGVLMLGLAGTVGAETLTLNSAINKAGRQRMLSQRIAKISMFRAWGIATPQMTQDLDAAIQEFAAAQAFLVSAPQNTAAIGSELQLAGTQWLFFEEGGPAAGGQPRRATAQHRHDQRAHASSDG